MPASENLHRAQKQTSDRALSRFSSLVGHPSHDIYIKTADTFSVLSLTINRLR